MNIKTKFFHACVSISLSLYSGCAVFGMEIEQKNTLQNKIQSIVQNIKHTNTDLTIKQIDALNKILNQLKTEIPPHEKELQQSCERAKQQLELRRAELLYKIHVKHAVITKTAIGISITLILSRLLHSYLILGSGMALSTIPALILAKKKIKKHKPLVPQNHIGQLPSSDPKHIGLLPPKPATLAPLTSEEKQAISAAIKRGEHEAIKRPIIAQRRCAAVFIAGVLATVALSKLLHSRLSLGIGLTLSTIPALWYIRTKFKKVAPLTAFLQANPSVFEE